MPRIVISTQNYMFADMIKRTLEEHIKLRHPIKQIDTNCKIVFLVDEKAEPVVAQKVRRAKTDGLID